MRIGYRRQLVLAAEQGSVGLITAVAGLARAELSLIPGAVDERPRAAAFVTDPRAVRPGPVELVVRVSIATAVAVSALTVGAMHATTTLTGAAVQVVTDVAEAASDDNPDTTVSGALARAPETLRAGVQGAGEELRTGARRARIGFEEALGVRRPEAALTTVRASGGSGTTVNGTDVVSSATTNATSNTATGERQRGGWQRQR